MLIPKNFKVEFEKPKLFFFHFNKPLSKIKGKPMISVHVADTCYAVENVSCSVKTDGKINKRQPLFVMRGKLKTLNIVDNVAFIS